MNRVAGEEDVFSRSFMCLGFIAAALIIVVQWKEMAGSEPVATSAQDSAASKAAPRVVQSELAPMLDGVIESALAISEAKIIIDLSDRQLYLYKNGALTANYEIAIGRDGWETPTGEFQVINMRVDPVWQHPFTQEIVPAGPANPLGSRWIGFWANGAHQIGLHGTNQEDLIGQAVSHGCIRLRETDIQALFELVSINTVVVVRS